MRAFLRFLKLGRKEPFSCLVSTLISATLVSALMAGIIYVVYMMTAVSLVKDIITSSTGFTVSAQNIYVNVFTGYCEIDGLNITNPSVYESNTSQKNIEGIDKFVHVQKLKMELSPIALLKGRFDVSSVYVNITYLNCVRISNSIYNLPEFLAGLKKVVSFKDANGAPYLKDFSIFIRTANYTDLSVKTDSISWNTKDFAFRKSEVSNFSNLLSDIKSDFEKANAPFILSGLKVLSNTDF